MGANVIQKGIIPSAPAYFPNIPDNIKENPERAFKFYLDIAQNPSKYIPENIMKNNKRYSSRLENLFRTYAAVKARREYGSRMKDANQMSVSANEQLGQMSQVQTVSDAATGGGFSDIVKCEEIFLAKSNITPKEALHALSLFLKGSVKTILALGLGTAALGKVVRVTGKGSTYLFKIIGKKSGKPVLQFIQKVLTKAGRTSTNIPVPKIAPQRTSELLDLLKKAKKFYRKGFYVGDHTFCSGSTTPALDILSKILKGRNVSFQKINQIFDRLWKMADDKITYEKLIDIMKELKIPDPEDTAKIIYNTIYPAGTNVSRMSPGVKL